MLTFLPSKVMKWNWLGKILHISLPRENNGVKYKWRGWSQQMVLYRALFCTMHRYSATFVGLRPDIQILCHVLARGWGRWLRYFTEAKAEVKYRASARIRWIQHKYWTWLQDQYVDEPGHGIPTSGLNCVWLRSRCGKFWRENTDTYVCFDNGVENGVIKGC